MCVCVCVCVCVCMCVSPQAAPLDAHGPGTALNGHTLTHQHTRHVLGLSWGADHRVVDGAGLAHASNALRGYLEHPERMLLRTC